MSTPKKTDKRPTITLKGEQFTTEFRTLINTAAKRAGQSQAQFIADTLTREAQRVIKGQPVMDQEGREAAPPALVTQRLDQQDERISAILDQMKALTALQQRSVWQRVRDFLGNSPVHAG